MPAASGAATTISRLSAGNQSSVSLLTSASVMPGRKRRWNASSCQIVGSASPLEEVARVFVGAARRLAVGTFRDGALIAEHHRLLRAGEFGRREAEPRETLQFCDECGQTARHSIIRYDRLQHCYVPCSRGREQLAVGGSAHERRIRAPGEFIEPGAEHVGKQLITHDLAVPADRPLVASGPQIADLHGRCGRLLVGHDRVAGAAVLGHVEGGPWPFGRRRGQRREVLLDHCRDGVAVDVADDDHRHQVGAVPVVIEPQQLFPLRVLDDVGFADGRAIGIARSRKLGADHFVLRPFIGVEMQPPFRQHDASLAIDPALIEGGALRPILQDEQRAIEDIGLVGRDPQCVLRIVVAGRRVRIRTDAETERRQEIDEPLFRKMPGTLELHVFDEVRQPLLIVVFENRPGLDNEPQLSAVRRLGVRADVIAEAVGQRPNEHVGIDRHRLRERIRRHRGGGRIVVVGRRLRG